MSPTLPNGLTPCEFVAVIVPGNGWLISRPRITCVMCRKYAPVVSVVCRGNCLSSCNAWKKKVGVCSKGSACQIICRDCDSELSAGTFGKASSGELAGGTNWPFTNSGVSATVNC